MAKSKNQKINHKINEEIKHQEVRVVGDNVDVGVYTIREALLMANSLGLDLIEITPKANPPVCKILDYNKFLYEIKKRQKEQEKKQKQSKIELKEMRFTPNTDTHDYEFKKRHIENFLKNGDRVRASVFFKGREIQFKEKGEIILLKLADELKDISSVNKLPVMEGHKMVMILNPKK